MGGSTVYVATSVELIKQIQKMPKQLAFPPIAAQFAMTVCASSKEANDILKINVNGEQGDDWGYTMTFYKILQPSLAPGPALDAMNRVMIQNVAASMEKLNSMNGKSFRIELSKWLRYEVTMATTNSVYGPMNPFKDPKVENAFWDFEDDFTMILMNVIPSITARKGHRARELMVSAFDKYFREKHHEKGSVLVQNRYRNSWENKIPVNDIARYEVGGSIAILVNTTPAAFWILLYIFAHQNVLQAVRAETTSILNSTTDSAGKQTQSLDITKVKTHCRVLTSVFTEVLRHKTMGIGVRKVMEDTILDGKLLKKGRTLLMPARVLHTDAAVWGPDVDEFNAKRFIREANTRQADPSAFRGFGGGSTLCPGRHFSTTEILSIVIMFVMRYDMHPVGGKWNFPSTDKSNIASAVMEPDYDIEVDVVPREGSQNQEWAFSLADSEMVFAVVAEDKAGADG